MTLDDRQTRKICDAISNQDVTLLVRLIGENRLKLISVSYAFQIKNYDRERKRFTYSSIDLMGRSFFHLAALAGNLDILKAIHSHMGMPIIPNKKPSLSSHNPFQYLWSQGRLEQLIYCISLSKHSDFSEIIDQLQIDTRQPFGHDCEKIPEIRPQDLFDQQKQWLANGNWEKLLEALEHNKLTIPIKELRHQKHSEAINPHGHLSYIYENHFVRADNEENSLALLDSPKRDNKKKSYLPSASMFSIKKLTIGTITFASLFYFLYTCSKDMDGNHNKPV